MKRIGIIGCGVIGTSIAEFVQNKLRKKAIVVALCDTDSEKAEKLCRRIKSRPIITDIEGIIKKSDLIVESASPVVSSRIARDAVRHKKDVLIMSTGGLLRASSLLKKAKTKGCNIYIPSGAICGLDGIRSASMGRIEKVTLTTRKPLKGLKGAPYFKKKKIDIDKIRKETIIYDGNIEEAIKYFPQNINVAATLSLIGFGPRQTKVKIITSPKYTKNIHEVEVEGEFGKLWTRTENVPSKENPKTSQLAIFSALAKLKEIL